MAAAIVAALVALAVGLGDLSAHGGEQLQARAYGLRAFPPVPAGVTKHRLLPSPAVGVGSAYSFEETLPDGLPVTWDPCRPIHYVVRSARLPSYGLALIHQAIARVSAATGLEFVDDGMTTEAPSPTRPLMETQYGDRWAPVLIAFSDASEYPSLGGEVMGRGGSAAVAPEGPASARYVTGQIVLDLADFASVRSRADGDLLARAAVMHELGHVVGLGHVPDTDQIMDPTNGGTTQFGTGDLAGLQILGSGLCHHDT
jgi:hypothetical protein